MALSSGSVLTHRLVDPHERVVIGSSVLLDHRQQLDLARLSTGQAVLHSASRAAPSVIQVDVDDAVWRYAHAEEIPLHAPAERLPWLAPSGAPRHGERAESLVRELAAAGHRPLEVRDMATRALLQGWEGDVEALLLLLNRMNRALGAERKARA